MDYNRITYPERAEYLDEGIFSDYKIFLDHWKPIGLKLKSNHEESVLRKVSKTLLIFGDQSTGKTLLANKIKSDFNSVKNDVSKGIPVVYNKENIWHLITSGYGLNTENITTNTNKSTLYHIEDNKNWVKETTDFCKSNSDRTCVIIADNCERDYFIQDLVGLTDSEYLAVGRTDALVNRAAVNYVALCRGPLRGAFVIMFTNDEIFALSFEAAVNKQHDKLVEIESLPFPGDKEKETVIRVNTNRLNPFSYWFCLDRAGMDEKKYAYKVIKESKNFKDCYHAIDNALQKVDSSRMGRPPKKCLLVLFVMSDIENVTDKSKLIDSDECVKNFSSESIDVTTYTGSWAKVGVDDLRKRRLLESEWNFRIVAASNKFVYELLNGELNTAKEIIDHSLVHHGPGTWEATKATYSAKYNTLIGNLQPHDPTVTKRFWSLGQVRSHEYEKRLKVAYPKYNTATEGFLTYRPDLTVNDYVPCSLLLSEDESDSNINSAIRRTTIACEFTAIKDLTVDNVATYVRGKLQNYIEIMDSQ